MKTTLKRTVHSTPVYADDEEMAFENWMFVKRNFPVMFCLSWVTFPKSKN